MAFLAGAGCAIACSSASSRKRFQILDRPSGMAAHSRNRRPAARTVRPVPRRRDHRLAFRRALRADRRCVDRMRRRTRRSSAGTATPSSSSASHPVGRAAVRRDPRTWPRQDASARSSTKVRRRRHALGDASSSAGASSLQTTGPLPIPFRSRRPRGETNCVSRSKRLATAAAAFNACPSARGWWPKAPTAP